MNWLDWGNGYSQLLRNNRPIAEVHMPKTGEFLLKLGLLGEFLEEKHATKEEAKAAALTHLTRIINTVTPELMLPIPSRASYRHDS
jgi:hypothetical protein